MLTNSEFSQGRIKEFWYPRLRLFMTHNDGDNTDYDDDGGGGNGSDGNMYISPSYEVILSFSL